MADFTTRIVTSSTFSLTKALKALRNLYGKPKPPAVTDPFELILYENVAYLADDERRDEAFEMLREHVGLSPEGILGAAASTLNAVGRKGIVAEQTAEKLRTIASIALEDFGGDLSAAVRREPREAVRALRKFPSIGEPGAEKVLLFSGSAPALALDSNALRVLLRLGFGVEEKSYAKSYKSAQAAADSEIPRTCAARIEAYQLLRRHGQELCKRNHPRCEACPLRPDCAYYQRVLAPGR
jgi:endonuclease III